MVMHIRIASFLLVLIASSLVAQTTISVDAGDTVCELSTDKTGINFDYLVDMDSRRANGARSLVAAMQDMATGFARYPGGEKSDAYLWATAPGWTPASHTMSLTGSNNWPANDKTYFKRTSGTFQSGIMDFDSFMAVCQAAGLEPVCVINFDSMYYTGGGAPSKALLIETAAEWVRYANITRGWNVRYWEIGNESDMSGSYNGIIPNISTYVADFGEFAAAMKAVDPTIRIGANANSSSNYRALLNANHANIDFLVVHTYPLWNWTNGYNTFRLGSPTFTGGYSTAAAAIQSSSIPQADKDRIRVAITECNTIDWSESGWANANDTGHALVLFDLIGQHLKQPALDFVAFWNTRWVNAERNYVYDALNNDNTFRPQGRTLAIWGQFLQQRLVRATSSDPKVLAYASLAPADGRLVLFILNKDGVEMPASIGLTGCTAATIATQWTFKGSSPTDTAPTWTQAGGATLAGLTASATLPAYSITVVEMDVELPVPLTPFQAWCQEKLGDGDAPEDGDPDHDGIANLLEYAWGLDPGQKDAHPLSGGYDAGTGPYIVFPRDITRLGINYLVETSSDLQTWTVVTSDETDPQTPNAANLLHKVHGPDNSAFLRLKITQ